MSKMLLALSCWRNRQGRYLLRDSDAHGEAILPTRQRPLLLLHCVGHSIKDAQEPRLFHLAKKVEGQLSKRRCNSASYPAHKSLLNSNACRDISKGLQHSSLACQERCRGNCFWLTKYELLAVAFCFLLTNPGLFAVGLSSIDES